MSKKVTTTDNNATESTQQNPIITLDVDLAVEKRLVALYTLQMVHSEIDKIQNIRGELPQSIKDLEDEITGLNTRINNFNNTISECELSINKKKNEIEEHKALIEKNEKQQSNVRNNREYESLSKEIEYQSLEIQLCERKIKDATNKIKDTQQHIDAANLLLANRETELVQKKAELENLITETEKEEVFLTKTAKEQEQFIEERYLNAYNRIRRNSRNGLACVAIDREACGGCFSQIPLQRQNEIKMHKKVIVCEHCGRILVDNDIATKAAAILKK